MPLTQLIYVSTATREMQDEDLRAILESSIRHNTAQAVTGLLLYAEGNFMQVLEGPAAAVEETMGRIRADVRNHDIHVLEHRRVDRREFGDWSMSVHRLGAAELARPGYVAFRDIAEAPASGGGGGPVPAVELLRNFASSFR